MAVNSITERLEKGPSVTIVNTFADLPDFSKGGFRYGDFAYVLDPPGKYELRPDLDVLSIAGLVPFDPSKAKWAQDDGDVASEDVVIFLNSTTGSDSNDGSSPATAIQTIEKLRKMVPLAWRKKCRAIFAPGTYPWPAGAPGTARVFPVGMTFPDSNLAEDMTWVGGFDVVLPTFVAAVGTGPTAIVLPAPVVVDQFRGAVVEVLTGAAAGVRVSIVSHPVGSLLLEEFVGGLAAGDQVRVVRPNVIIDIGAASQGRFLAIGGGNCSLHLFGIKFLSNSQFAGYNFEGVTLSMVGCEFEINAGLLFIFKKARMQGNIPNIGADFASFLNRTGTYVHSTDPIGCTLSVLDYGEWTANLITEKVNVVCNRFSYGAFGNFDAVNSVCQVTDNSEMQLLGGPNSILQKLAIAQSFLTEGGVTVPTSTVLCDLRSLLVASGLLTQNNAQRAYLAERGGRVQLANVTGLANGSAGLQVANYSVGQINAGTTVAGVDEVLLESGAYLAVVTYAALAVAPEAVISTRGSIVFRRVPA